MIRGYLRRSSRKSIITVVCMALLASSFAMMPTGSTSSTDDSATLRVGMMTDLLDFNYFNLASNADSKRTMLGFVYEGIAGIDYDSMPYPLLAQSWSFDEDTLTLDIELREGVDFHDGQELMADDVVFSYTVLRSGTTVSDELIQAFDTDGDYDLSLAEIEAAVWETGDHSVRMTLAKPYGQFFVKTLTIPIIPKHIWEDHVDPVTQLVEVYWGDDPAALIGTGPFQYAGGVTNMYRTFDKNTAYWGQDAMTPDGYSLYPPNVDRLHFEIVGDIDSAIAALTDGSIDHIQWPVPASKLPLIDTVPSIAIDYLDDAGYFYLAFNEKKEPFGSILFRKAVSHLIDKARIVDEFMGGLGSPGTTPVPTYFGAWHNEAVVDYAYDDPDDPTTDVPEFLLNEAGFVDADGDGWRDLPDGTPMEKLTILTPPADYDPARAQTGFMIADNLVKVGINAEACPVDFLTIVEQLESFEYQMLILGFRFTGYSECVSVLFDIFGHASPSNSWAFWSEENPNPYYSGIGDVSTLADATTQELVDEFADLEAAARSSMDVSEQISYVRAGQEIISDAVPLNILYYRVNPMATRVTWTGWVPCQGTLLNAFSLSELTGPIEVEKFAGAASESTVSTAFLPEADGQWSATILNDGLKGLVVSVYLVDGVDVLQILRETVSFKGDPSAVLSTSEVSMVAGQQYILAFTPLGPEGGSASVAMSFET